MLNVENGLIKMCSFKWIVLIASSCTWAEDRKINQKTFVLSFFIALNMTTDLCSAIITINKRFIIVFLYIKVDILYICLNMAFIL